MSRERAVRGILRAAVVGSVPWLAAPASLGCRLPAEAAEPPLLLVEKGSTQSVYDSEGRLQRLLIDADGDRRADTQILYRPQGTPLVAEIDADRDGVVDRWERFAADGSLECVARSLRARGRPDVWDYAGNSGRVARSEFDDDGDGTVDRVVRPAGEDREGLVEELDTDRDGKPDRRLLRTRAGAIIAVEIDRDQDGVWERREPVRPR